MKNFRKQLSKGKTVAATLKKKSSIPKHNSTNTVKVFTLKVITKCYPVWNIIKKDFLLQ